MPRSRAWISNSRADRYAAASSSPDAERAASADWAARVRASRVLARLRSAEVWGVGFLRLKGRLEDILVFVFVVVVRYKSEYLTW